MSRKSAKMIDTFARSSHSSPWGTPILRKINTALFAVGACLGASSAHAQTASHDGLAFDDAKHRGWYVRFWTGSCAELRYVICLAGAPYWSEIMERLLASVPAARRELVRARLVRLGRSVGYEWARENNIRRINNGHIKAWSADLERSKNDPESAVARIEWQARYILGGTGDPVPGYARRY
jgi:hypothetical protein